MSSSSEHLRTLDNSYKFLRCKIIFTVKINSYYSSGSGEEEEEGKIYALNLITKQFCNNIYSRLCDEEKIKFIKGHT
jgi:hypothetical protein